MYKHPSEMNKLLDEHAVHFAGNQNWVHYQMFANVYIFFKLVVQTKK